MVSKWRRHAKLSLVRQQIDRLDLHVLRLLNQRAHLALEIGRIKQRRKWPVFNAAREAMVLRHVQRANRGPLSARALIDADQFRPISPERYWAIASMFVSIS